MIGVVFNPNARGAARDPGLPWRLRALLGDAGELHVTRTQAELEAAIDRLAERGCTLVATCGGDGTNLSTITQVVRRFGESALPRFALLRGGTVNTVARNLAIRGRPEELLARLVAANGDARVVAQDLLAVEGPASRMYGFLFAAGMGARFLERYYGGRVQGSAWATVLAARTIGSALVQGPFARALFHPEPCEIVADGERAPIDAARLVLASVVADVGIGMRVTWQAGREAQRFHLVASSLGTPAMALQIGRVLGGRPLAGQPHVDRLAREVVLRFSREQSYTLDGDMFRAREVTIRIGPRLSIVRA